MPLVHVVADTNTVVSGLLWHGTSRQVLDAARTGVIMLSTSAPLLAELAEVLQRPKFAQRLARVNVTPYILVFGYAALARLVAPAPIGPVVAVDPDDDAVLACAVAAQVEVIVSGDSDLLALESYEGILISMAAQLMALIVFCAGKPCRTKHCSRRLPASARCAVKAVWKNVVTPVGIQVSTEPLELSIIDHSMR